MRRYVIYFIIKKISEVNKVNEIGRKLYNYITVKTVQWKGRSYSCDLRHETPEFLIVSQKFLLEFSSEYRYPADGSISSSSFSTGLQDA